MKIAICSDLHLEFGDINLQNTENADVLILGGDICVAADIGKPDPHNFLEGAKSNRITDFFKRCSFQFPHVIYIMGNHEHYHGDFATSGNKIKSMLESNMLSNVYLLDKESKVIDDVTFIGGTLWTDFNREDSLCMWHAGQSMNDYKVCKNSLRGYSGGGYASRLQPEDTLKDHQTMLDYIDIVVGEKPDQQFVVVGHHAPCSTSVAEQYRADTLMNGNFYTDLSEFILDRPQIRLWVHGHMHNVSDYEIGTTRVVCNPRGYVGHERRAELFELKYLEIE
jgi:Icc-related predicted phosphoesterase